MADQADAGNGVKRESKVGIGVQFVLSVLAIAGIGWLTDLDLSTLPGWAASAAGTAVAAVIAFLTAYKTKNPPVL